MCHNPCILSPYISASLRCYLRKSSTNLSAVSKGCILALCQQSGEPDLVDRVLALHAGSRGFDSHRGHMSKRFFRSNRPGYPHPLISELENSGIRGRSVIAVSLKVGGGVRLIKLAKLYMCRQNTTNTTRTDA